MALRPNLNNTASPVRIPPFVPPPNIIHRENNILKSNVLPYGNNYIQPLPKIPLPTLPDIMLNNMNTFTLPTDSDIQDTIASLSCTKPHPKKQDTSPSSNNSLPSNHESLDDETDEDIDEYDDDATTSSDDDDDDNDSTLSSHQDDDEYDYFDDYDQTHKHDENEDHEFESKYRKKLRPSSSILRKTLRKRHKKRRRHRKRKKAKTQQEPDEPQAALEGSLKIVHIKPSKGGEGDFSCKKCRRTFSTNRALASHQRAHKNKIPPPHQIQIKTAEPELDNDIWMKRLNGIIPQQIQLETNQAFLRNLPNLNTVASIKDLKNMNLTRLAMPVIKGRKRYQINNQNISPHFNDEDYKFHCDKCNAAFFYQSDVVKHKQYSECVERPYLCPFCERPFKSCLSVKKHCVNLHSSIINWDLVGELLDFVNKHEAKKQNQEINYAKLVRKFARDFYLWGQIQQQKDKAQRSYANYTR